jgi:predicted outer membrane lipoprotein
MERRGDEVHVDIDEARAASSPNVVRWVLGISLAAAIVLLSAIWIFGAATGDHAEPTAREAREAIAGQRPGTDTDTIVDERADELGEPVTDRDTQGPGRVEN